MTPVQLLTVGTLLSDHAISPAESLSSEHDNITVTGTVEVPQTPIPLDPDDFQYLLTGTILILTKQFGSMSIIMFNNYEC